MQVTRGSGRIVLLLGHYVFKFPRLHHLLQVVKPVLKLVITGHWAEAIHLTKRAYDWFYRGVLQNLTEYRCWKSCRAPFLTPTYFSIGIMNVQRLEKGHKPSDKEIGALIGEMGDKTKNYVYTIDPHCLKEKNFVKGDYGYRLVDYGDSSYQPLRFTEYIVEWQNELTTIFCATQVPPA